MIEKIRMVLSIRILGASIGFWMAGIGLLVWLAATALMLAAPIDLTRWIAIWLK